MPEERNINEIPEGAGRATPGSPGGVRGPRPDAPDPVAFRKEDIHKIVEDPYFKYLVDKTARSQTWTFLASVGSIIAAILLYAGLEFRSARGEIDEAKKAINDDVVASRQEVQRVKADSQEARAAAENAQAQLTMVDALITRVDAYGQESERRALSMVGAAQSQINSFAATQQGFITSQRGLLDSVSAVTGQAAQNVRQADALLTQLKRENIPEKLTQVQEHLGEIESARTKVEETTDKVDETYRQVETQVKSLKRLEDVNLELIKARTSESIILRAHQSSELQLPDLTRLSANRNTQAHLWVTFGVEGLGRSFKLFWRVRRDDGTEVSKGTQQIKAPEKQSGVIISRAPFALTGTPYEVLVEYENFGLFAHDFVVLRVRPQRQAAPSIRETS